MASVLGSSEDLNSGPDVCGASTKSSPQLCGSSLVSQLRQALTIHTPGVTLPCSRDYRHSQESVFFFLKMIFVMHIAQDGLKLLPQLQSRWDYRH